MDLGKTITRLRREQGMTQEQLGQMLGVSGQAVSKWENGGTPDAEMIPSIADRLGVTIDALYGRESEPTENMAGTLNRWLAAIPKEQRMNELFGLLCSTFQRPYYTDSEMLGDLLDALVSLPMKSCYSTDILHQTDDPMWMRSGLFLEEGLQLGVLSEDFPMFLLMPEPECGYEANFGDDESCRKAFAALAMPGSLELLRCLYGRKQCYYSAKAISKLSGLELAVTEEALRALEACHIVNKTEVEDGDAPMDVYSLHDTGAFIPLMLFVRWLSDGNDAFVLHWKERKRPVLGKRREGHA